ncbi:hypothetical protein SRHO_G00016470 [Serrasalmus rhombeus]
MQFLQTVTWRRCRFSGPRKLWKIPHVGVRSWSAPLSRCFNHPSQRYLTAERLQVAGMFHSDQAHVEPEMFAKVRRASVLGLGSPAALHCCPDAQWQGSASNSYLRPNSQHLYKELDNIRTQRTKLERKKKASAWEKNLLYPIVMLILLAGTAISVFLVALNILYLLVDETALPKGSADPDIGNASLSTFGVVQAVVEIILMIYLMVSSVVGFYSLRIFKGLTPRKDDTTMTTIIGCCVSILVLSSALPVMSRTLGITRFDLLGDFGRFNWLGNFYIVLSYNLLFAVVTTLCLVRKFTSAVREELLKALGLDKLNLSNSPTEPEPGKIAANGHQKTL